MKQNMEKTDSKFELRKEFGIMSAIALLCGTMVGSGIFVSPSGVLAAANGDVGLSLVLWIACGVIACLASLCYAELGSCIHESGADFAYHNKAYGPPMAFLYAWTSILVVRNTSNAATALTFGIYLIEPFYAGSCESPEIAVKASASKLILTITYVNYFTTKGGAYIQNICTIAKFLAMAIIVVAGIVAMAKGSVVGVTNFTTNFFNADNLAGVTFSQIGLGLYQGLFSYDGWNNLNYVTEEVKNPRKNLPRAIIIAVPVVTVSYFLVNTGYFAVLTPSEILSSKAVAVTFGNRVLGVFAWIMPLSVCLSTAGSLNGSYMSGGRMPFVAARRGHMPEILEMVHVNYYTPTPSLLLNTFLSLLMMIPANFDVLLYAFSFTAWMFYGLSALAVIVLRKTHPDIERPYKVPLLVPITVVLIALYLVIAPLVDAPSLIYLYATVFMVSGFIVYYPLVHKQMRVPGMASATAFFQVLLEVAPTDWEDDKFL